MVNASLSEDERYRFDNDPCAKLLRWRGSEKDDDLLTLHFAPTSYYTHCCTNRALAKEVPFKPEKTMDLLAQICHFLESKGEEFQERVLANPLSVNMMLIGRKNGCLQTLLIKRATKRLAEAQGHWHCSASGYVLPRRSKILVGGDIPGYEFMKNGVSENIDLFLAAQRELWEELAVNVPISHIRLVALCNRLAARHPQVFFEAFVDKDLDMYESILSNAVEQWEIDRHTIITLDLEGFSQIVKGKGKEPPLFGPEDSRGTWNPVGRLAVLLAFVRYVDGAWEHFLKLSSSLK